jgi:hypothetical protein
VEVIACVKVGVQVIVLLGVLVAVTAGVLVGVPQVCRNFMLSTCRSMAPFALLAHCRAIMSFRFSVPGPP